MSPESGLSFPDTPQRWPEVEARPEHPRSQPSALVEVVVIVGLVVSVVRPLRSGLQPSVVRTVRWFAVIGRVAGRLR
jgi:hypothetical protein